MRSSNYSPYTGKLSKKDNLIVAIDLAKLCKNFANKEQMDEAMNIKNNQWIKVIDELEDKLLKCK